MRSESLTAGIERKLFRFLSIVELIAGTDEMPAHEGGERISVGCGRFARSGIRPAFRERGRRGGRRVTLTSAIARDFVTLGHRTFPETCNGPVFLKGLPGFPRSDANGFINISWDMLPLIRVCPWGSPHQASIGLCDS